MKIGILQTGYAPDALRDAGDYPDMFETMLAGHGFTFKTYRVVDMEFPTDLRECDGYVITGSKHGVYEDHPFIAPLEQLIRDAKMLEEIGCFGVVLEKIPAALATNVAQTVQIPIIGIGAGNGVDGQVLVVHDMLGINNEFNPRFLRKYHNLHEQMLGAFTAYIRDVQTGDFPNDKEQY